MYNLSRLLYFVKEREAIRIKKEGGLLKPWSSDPTFRTTYFCNVRREDDRVTKWIRTYMSPRPIPDYEWLMCLARLFNRPETLFRWEHPKFQVEEHHIESYIRELMAIRSQGLPVFSGAYLVSTNGQKIDKLLYIEGVLKELLKGLDSSVWESCQHLYDRLVEHRGFGSFMAAQVVADCKNTAWHDLHTAPDWYTFVAEGPGSLRGMSWLLHDTSKKTSKKEFKENILPLRDEIENGTGMKLCAQDTQNVLCEFDKYMRVTNNVGRSKRKYNGI